MTPFDNLKNSKPPSRLLFYSAIIGGIALGLGKAIFTDNSPLTWVIFIVIATVYLIVIQVALSKQADASLKLQVYDTFLNQSNDAVFVLDLQGRHIIANQSASNLLGYSLPELEKLSFRDIVVADEISDSENVLKTLLEGGKLDIYERVFRKKNGEEVEVEVNVQLIRDSQGKPLNILSILRDISERKEAERAIKVGQERLRTFIDVLPDRAVILDAEGRYHDVLKNFPAGFNLALERVQGKTVYDVFPKEFADYCLQVIQDTLAKNSTQIIEYDFVNANYNIRVEGRVAPLYDAETGETLVFWISRDITPYKKAEIQLIHYNRLQNLLISLATDFINLPIEEMDNFINKLLQQIGEFIEADRSYINWISDEGDKVYAGTAYEWFSPQIDSKRKSFLDIQTPTDISDFTWTVNQYRNAEPILIHHIADLPAEALKEKETLTASGVQSSLTVPLTRNNKLIGAMGFQTIHSEAVWTADTVDLLKMAGQIYLNALARKASKQALADSEMLLRLLIEALPDRTVVFDENGYCTEIIKSDYDAFNSQLVPPLRQKGQSVYDVYPEEFANFCMQKIGETLENNKPLAFGYTSPIQQGVVYELEARTIPFLEPRTMQRQVFWVTRDVTERKMAEKQRMELTIAQEKNEVLRQFVDSMTHDLKTPLTVINTNLYLLNRYQDPAKQKAVIQKIYKQLELILQMLDDMLAVAHLDNVPELEWDEVDLALVVKDILDSLEAKAEQKQLEVEVKLSADSVSVLASVHELRRALTNVVDNAIKYTPEKGQVFIDLSYDDSNVILRVRDTGIGIPYSELEQVFDRFYRSDNARNSAPGTGLGLEISRRIIEFHKGEILVESELGKGSNFTIRLPRLS